MASSSLGFSLENTPLEKVYVVFEGRKPGFYHSWPAADVQVNGFKGNRHQSFESFEQAWNEWVEYCHLKGRDPYKYRNVRGKEDIASSSNGFIQRSSGQFAEDTDSSMFIIQQSMQKQLQQMCHILQIQPPTYTLQQVKTINGQQYCRYYASIATSAIGRPAVSMGKFAKTDYDAQEDVTALLIRRLLAVTGKQIRDLNYYNVQVLEEQLNNTMNENIELREEIAMLNAEMKFLK